MKHSTRNDKRSGKIQRQQKEEEEESEEEETMELHAAVATTKHGNHDASKDDEDDSDADDDDDSEVVEEEEEEVEKVDAPTTTVPTTTATTAITTTSSSTGTGSTTTTTEPQAPPQLTFAALGLCPELITICEQDLLWKLPTPIQQQVIPYAIGTSCPTDTSSSSIVTTTTPKDIIALAQTGSGKTGAFLLPIFHNLLTRRHTNRTTPSSKSTTTTTTTTMVHRRGSAVLILTPTRELAVQIYQVVQAFTHGIGVTGCCIVGGVDRVPQALALMQYPHVIIATPGRFVDHLKDTKGFSIQHSLQYLVLDEADRMLSMDFEQELHTILDVIPTERQTMLFSATMTSQVQKLQRVSLNTNHVQRVEVSTKFQTPASLLQYYLFIPAKYKDIYLTYLLNEAMGKSIIVFSATCNNTQRLAILLRNLNFPAVALHGQLNQNARLGCLQKFMSGQRSIMICTDVASRGLDIPNVDMVINYDLPNHGKEYIHRVGRTARAGKSGQAISFVTQYDVEIYQRIELLLGYQLPSYIETHPNVQEETVLIFAERVNEAQRLATRELKEQLANGGFGGNHKNSHHKRRKNNNNNDHHDTEEGGGGGTSPYHQQLQHQIQQKYRVGGSSTGGSGNKGGALPNQRGSGRQNKKYKHHK